MVKITLHIERLLVHNDCVIVPGLGGFVAQDCSATYVEEEDLFLPPYRSVSFNQRLRMNDGLLIHDVAQHHHLDYKDAVRVVDEEVAKIRETIESEGQYKFHGIGTLRSTDKGALEFEPIPCGVSAPDLYGLDCYYVTPLQKTQATPKNVTVSKHDDDTLTLRLHMNVVRYAAVAAVAAVFFFVCIAPLNSAIEHQRSEAGMLHYLYSLIVNSHSDNTQAVSEVPTPVTVKPAKVTINVEAESQSQNEANDAAIEADEDLSNKNESAASESPVIDEGATASSSPASTLKSEAKEKELPYAIVIASCVTERNANAMIESWKTKGLPSASIYDKGKYLRVFYGSYDSYESAHATLTKLRSEHPAEFAEAWVYEIH